MTSADPFLNSEGAAGGERLKSIFGYDQLISKMNTNTQTIGYVLLEDIDGKYKIKINWKQKELRDNLAFFYLVLFQ
ncbi:8079_t:CDS:2 [Entrophospora sp. SA101]|nr:8079_t:CDS:2 [Entrophospora sp. SA101]